MIGQLKNTFNQHLLLVIALIVCALVYSKFLFFGHISWDDPEMVFKNKAVRDMDLKALFSNHYVGNYIPVTMTVHSLAWLFFESNDTGHHLLNILLHLFNGILVYRAGKIIFKNNHIAVTGLIIFLLHPLQVESVGWISELKNILSATFYLAALLTYCKFRETKRPAFYLFSIAYFAAACLSKSSAVVFPLVLIVLDFFLDKRISGKNILNKLPFLALSVLFGIINIKAQTADQFINYSHAFPYFQRIGLAGFALLKYLGLFLVPNNLSIIYPYPELKTSVIVTGYLFLAVISGILIYLVKKKKYDWLFLVLFVLLNLLLVLQLLPFGETLYADRYMYVPMIGFAWLLGALASKIKIQQFIIGAALIAVLGFLTFSRSSAWKSALDLYNDILKKYPTQFIALNSAGVESMMMNDDGRSLEYFNKAVKAAPKNYKSYYNRGLLYLKNNKPDLAIKSFNQVINLYDYSKAYAGRACAYYMLNDFPKAINDARHVLEMETNNPKAHFVLGNCYDAMNKLPDAMREYNKCIELNNEDPDYYFKRAIVFGKEQDFTSCLNDLSLCIELNPFYYEAYYWRGVAKVNLKQDPCDDFRISARNNVPQAVAAFNKYCR
ncbi:MAG: tetratricopeptide repeat protein [Bacteroidetes bacterium]|nr:tetratricopeptide repeat protein [Bacteroidota bacterium]